MTFEDATLDSINDTTLEENKQHHASFDAQMQQSNSDQPDSLSQVALT